MKDATYLSNLEKVLLGLSDKTRLRILNLIRDGEISVGYFTEILGDSQPKISRHLAYLRRVGLVVARREGTWMHYSIDWPDDAYAVALIEGLLDGLGARPEMQNDRKRMSEALRKAGVKITATKPVRRERVSTSKPSKADPSPQKQISESREEEEIETFLL